MFPKNIRVITEILSQDLTEGMGLQRKLSIMGLVGT